jgi:hypothetical protein
MKDKRDNEIDLLLRRMSRRDVGAVAEAEIDEKHLDADELSAYAQNALPPAARARYVAHLAECASCRRLATELSLSLGAATVAEVETVPTPGGLSTFFAKLFSPMVMRYAVPVLGVIVVMVVGFVVLRQRQPESSALVAQVETKQQSASASNTQAEAPVNGETHEGFVAVSPEKPASIANPADAAKPATKTAEPQPTAVATDSVAAAAQQLPPSQRSVAELQPGVASSAPAPAAAKAGSVQTEAEKKAPSADKQQETVAETVEVKNEPTPSPSPTSYNANANTNEDAAQNKTKTGAVAPAGGAYSVRGLSAMRRREEAKREQDAKTDEAAKDEARENARDDAETRSVGGRQFHKTRGIWVDTAYDSSTATVNMARGSEQFRALIGDEPVIGTIAKQLDGEVIVVWKGRAYRIR